jgi:hypothetical protein
MALVAITMTNTKAITPIKPLAFCGFLSVVLIVLGSANIFYTVRPFAERNHQIEENFNRASVLPSTERIVAEKILLSEQENVLARIPSEPFAWARLAFMREDVLDDKKSAFAALRMSNLVSPNEPRQKLERALMWYEFNSVEDKSEKAYQTNLWEKVIAMPNDKTWQDQKHRGLVTKAKDILLTTRPDLYSQLNGRD